MKTTDSLDRLNHNIKYADNMLNNVANSLTTLQYGNQFVEYRVHDDDETNNNHGDDIQTINGMVDDVSMTILYITK